jgi:hypothetical protein
VTDTLLADIELVSSGSLTGSFATVTGFSVTVNIVGPASVVALAFMLNGDMGDSSDDCGEYRFTVDGSPTGSPHLTSFKDSTDEGSGRSMMWTVDGLSAGSHTFTVEGINRTGTVDLDTTRIRLFQVLELDGATTEIIVDIVSTSADTSSGSWVELDEMGAAVAVTSDSAHLMLGTLQQELTSTDEAARIQFAIDTVRDGPSLAGQADNVNEGDGVCISWVETGLTGTIDFALFWQTNGNSGDAATDTGINRILQVIERTTNFNLLIDIQSVSAGESPAVVDGFEDVPAMSASPSVTSTSSVMLTLFNMKTFRTGGGGDVTQDFRITRGGSQVGGVVPSFGDASARTPGQSLMHVETGISGSQTWAGQWALVKTDGDLPNTDTDNPRTLQTLELLPGVAGPAPFLPVYIRRQALNPILVR